MSKTDAEALLKKVGVANATGDVLAIAYATLISTVQGGEANQYFEHLRKQKDDKAISDETKRLILDRAAAWDVLIA